MVRQFHPGKLTWNPKIDKNRGLEDDLPFQLDDFWFHVNFPPGVFQLMVC